MFRLDVEKILDTIGKKIDVSTAFVLEASFVDDAAHPIVASPHEILRQIKLAINILDFVFTKYGLALNFKQGKTEVLIVFAGAGSGKVKQQILVDMQGKIPFCNMQGEEKELIVTDCYKNLGSKVVVSQSLNPENIQRMGSMKAKCKEVKGKILKNPHVEFRRKAMVVRSALYAKGFFHCGTWRRLRVAEGRRIHGSVMSIWRSLLMLDSPLSEHRNDDSILQQLEVLPPLSFVVHMRLVLFYRLLRKPPSQLWLVLCNVSSHPESWLATVLGNLNALAEVFPKWEEMKGCGLSEWVQLIIGVGKSWKKMVLQALSHPAVLNVSFWYIHELKHASLVTEQSNIAAPIQSRFYCSVCDCSCKTVQGLSWHMFDKHGRKSDLRNYIPGTYCPACLYQFHSRERVIRHATRSSPRCHRVIMLTLARLTKEEVDSLDAASLEVSRSLASKGFRREFASKPPVKMFGPLVFEALENHIHFDSRLKGKTRNCL